VLRRLGPPLLELRLLPRRARVLLLEDLRPVVPAAHLPKVDDRGTRAGGPALVPGAHERGAAVGPIRAEPPGVRLIGLRPGPEDVDRLVQVEAAVRHAPT